jgi:hypothetical protein
LSQLPATPIEVIDVMDDAKSVLIHELGVIQDDANIPTLLMLVHKKIFEFTPLFGEPTTAGEVQIVAEILKTCELWFIAGGVHKDDMVFIRERSIDRLQSQGEGTLTDAVAALYHNQSPELLDHVPGALQDLPMLRGEVKEPGICRDAERFLQKTQLLE